MGGAFLNLPDVYSLGLAVTDSCHATYNVTKTGLGPFGTADTKRYESIMLMWMLGWSWYNGSNLAYDPSQDTNPSSREQGKDYGHFITDAVYDSFPETIESIFYAYRITGDTKWQDYNWEIFEALVRESTGTVPNAPISDVNVPMSFINELPAYVIQSVRDVKTNC